MNDERASTTAGAGKLGAEIKVATVFSASVGGDAGRETSTSTSSERTHRVAFKVPVHMNASYAGNPDAAENAAWLLKQHGVDG